MPSESQDWSALASHNERVVVDPAPQPGPGAEPRPGPARPAALVKGRLRLRKRPAATAQRC